MRRLLLGVALLAVACGGDDSHVTAGTSAPSTTAVPVSTTYQATATVIEDEGHGPELCLGGVETSDPPQCEGPALLGWDWDAVDDEIASVGSTYGDYRVEGTWDGEALTVTQVGPPEWADSATYDFPQACDDPIGDPSVPEGDSLHASGRPDVLRAYVSYDPFVANVLVRPGAVEAVTAAVQEQWPGLLCVVEADLPSRDDLDAVQREVEMLYDEDTPLGDPIGISILGLDPYVTLEVDVLTEEGRAYAEERWGDLVHVTGILQPVTEG